MLSTNEYIPKTMIWFIVFGFLLPLPIDRAIATYSYDLGTSMNSGSSTHSKVSNRNATLRFYSGKYSQDNTLLQSISAKEHPITHTENAFGVTIDWQFID